MAAKKSTGTAVQQVIVSAPNIQSAVFHIVGVTPLVMHKFSAKARAGIREKMEQTTAQRKKKEPKDFQADYHDAIHFSFEGWPGFPASGFRAAMIRACSLVGYEMTRAKMSIFVIGDGIDADEGTPLVKINGEHQVLESAVRVQLSTTVIWRPIFHSWNADLRVQYDADQFSLSDITNLLARAGAQVGIGEGRPLSKTSVGVGWGTFRVA